MTKIAGSGFISQRHGSPDPDPPQNVMDPQHCSKVSGVTTAKKEEFEEVIMRIPESEEVVTVTTTAVHEASAPQIPSQVC